MKPVQQNNNQWLPHYLELRRRLIKSLLTIAIVFLSLLYFAKDIYYYIALPLLNNLPHTGQMIATTVAAPFLVPLKLTLYLSFFIAIPILLYHLWMFITPGLYQHERRLIWPLLISSSVLFYSGMVLAYFVVFPLLFNFFTHSAPKDVTVMTDMSAYLSFIVKLLFAFGISFEVPVAVVLLFKTGIVNRKQLQRSRPYVIVAALVLGMLLTPPDVISQVMLAVPVWLLFETGVLLTRLMKPISLAIPVNAHKAHKE